MRNKLLIIAILAIISAMSQAMAATNTDMQNFCSSKKSEFDAMIEYGKMLKQKRKNKQFDLPDPPKYDHFTPCLDSDKSITQKYNKEKQDFVKDYFKKDDEMLAKAFELGREVTFLGGDNVLDHINTDKAPSSGNTSYPDECKWMGDTGVLAKAIESMLQYKYERANTMYNKYHDVSGAESALIDIMLQTEQEATLLGAVSSNDRPMYDKSRQLIEQQINEYETQLYQEGNYNLLDNTQYYLDLLAQDAKMGGDIDINEKMKKLENAKKQDSNRDTQNCNKEKNKGSGDNKNNNKGRNDNNNNKKQDKVYYI